MKNEKKYIHSDFESFIELINKTVKIEGGIKKMSFIGSSLFIVCNTEKEYKASFGLNITQPTADEQTGLLQTRVRDLENAIEGALRCRDLWMPVDNPKSEHEGEYQMMKAMETSFIKLLK